MKTLPHPDINTEVNAIKYFDSIASDIKYQRHYRTQGCTIIILKEVNGVLKQIN